MKPPVIIIFCRLPRIGTAKTRLARGIGPAQALRFYRATLQATIRSAGRLPRFETVLCVTPDSALHARDWPGGSRLVPQGSGDLGQRMVRALDRFRDRDRILIGGDIPDLRPHHLRQAMALAHRHDVTFGPAADGGFWLVGLRGRASPPHLFRDVRWSHPETLADCLRGLSGAWRVGMASRLNDVDDLGDYRRQMNRR
ncbi:MAG: TIGR04282 family arsenosugar biosynthesis glycosyltransferase [Minwuia sp.]|nr:TIGR04282 family arsenosugar biosynthesis glycosyltransferase [Minwuia sp.]